MRMKINQKYRVVEIWEGAHESADVLISDEALLRLKRGGYAVCVYKSGAAPLIGLTSRLLTGNIYQ